MRINIASTNRFHLLDLARELTNLGHDVKFYSYVPTRRCVSFGLNSQNCYSLLWIALPFLFLSKVFPKYNYKLTYYRNILLDFFVSRFMRKCDIFICIGSVYNNSIISAKKKYRAKTILEWGSKHIIEQLNCFNKLDKYPHKLLDYDLKSYTICDYISIPSDHVKRSFIKHNIPYEKLIINPYGVDLHQFSPTSLDDNFDIITVGGWRFEKGSDLLINLCKKYKYRLLHVGSIVGYEFPKLPNMCHVDSVNQSQLRKYYSKAKIFVLPSRAEGLALVQAQAMACGLPIVCSKETGGKDLRDLISDKKWIIEMNNLTLEELNSCVIEALNLSKSQKGVRNYLHKDLENLSWKAYGNRYNNNIDKYVK